MFQDHHKYALSLDTENNTKSREYRNVCYGQFIACMNSAQVGLLHINKN